MRLHQSIIHQKREVMKKLSVLLVAIMLLSALNLGAHDPGNPESLKNLSLQIKELLKDNPINVDHWDKTARIFFRLNSDNEIVVVNVKSKSSDLVSFINTKLNDQRIEVDFPHKSQIFVLPLRVTL